MKKFIKLCVLLILLISIKHTALASSGCPACKYITEYTRQITQKAGIKKCLFCQEKIDSLNNQYCRFFTKSTNYDFHFACFEQFSSLFKELSRTCDECKNTIKETLSTIPQNCRGSRIVSSPQMNEYSEDHDASTEISCDQEPIGRCWACILLFFPCLIRCFLGEKRGCKDCPIAYAEACKIACCCGRNR